MLHCLIHISVDNERKGDPNSYTIERQFSIRVSMQSYAQKRVNEKCKILRNAKINYKLDQERLGRC